MAVESVENVQRRLPWSCETNLGTINIKKWFIGVITPDFESVEARVRCGSFPFGDEGSPVDHGYIPEPRLQDATRAMREASGMLNPKAAAGYVKLLDGDSPKNLYVRWFGKLEPGSIRSASLALMATALGAGALAIPFAFSLTGVGLGLATLFAAAMVSALSLQILMVAARYTGLKSYAELLELAAGSAAASLMLDLTVVLNGVGAVTCILIFEGDFLPAIFKSPPGGLPGFALPRSWAVAGAALAAWPLTLPDDISALRYVSILVPLAVMITVAIVLTDTPELHREVRELGGAAGRVQWWDFEPMRWLKAASIMVNAFANHQNAVPVARQLDNPSVARIVKTTVNANLAVWALLASMGMGGYMSWAGLTKGDFLLNYPDGRPEIWICRIMLSLVVYLVLPVSILPTAKSGAQLILRLCGHRTAEISGKAHAMSATLLLCGCTTIALLVSDVAAVIGVLGGVLASSLMFWFPALVFWKLLWPTQPRFARGPALAAIVFFGVTGFSSVILPIVFSLLA